MKVKLLVARGGLGFSQNKDEIITVGDDEGLRMIKSCQAVLIEEIETASKNKPETASKKKGKK